MASLTTRRPSFSHPRQCGAAAVEFALVLPLLMMLVFGTIDWGFYFWQTQVCTNAAREGAREGSLYRVDDGVAKSEAETTANAYISSGLLDTSKAEVDAVVRAVEVEVTVVYEAGSLTGFTGYVFPDTIRAVAVMRR